MAWYAVSAILFWGICLVLSRFSRQEHPFVERPAFVAVGMVAIFLGLGILVGGTSVLARDTGPYSALFFIFAFLPGLVLALPWVLHSVSLLAGEAQREITGVDSMVVRRTYDDADRLMHDRRFLEAERAFLSGAEEETGDPEPLRRAGEAALGDGRPADAVRHFRRALPRITSAEDRTSLGIRISEIEQRTLGDADAARKTLEALLAGETTEPWRGYLVERLERLE